MSGSLKRDAVCCACGGAIEQASFGIDWKGTYCLPCFEKRPHMTVKTVTIPRNGSRLPSPSSER